MGIKLITSCLHNLGTNLMRNQPLIAKLHTRVQNLMNLIAVVMFLLLTACRMDSRNCFKLLSFRDKAFREHLFLQKAAKVEAKGLFRRTVIFVSLHVAQHSTARLELILTVCHVALRDTKRQITHCSCK
jgi:hypothetical protein